MRKFLKILMIFIGLATVVEASAMETAIEKEISTTQAFFNSLSKENLKLVDEFYDTNALFVDPLGRHQGLDSIRVYYARLYENVISIRFEYEGEVQKGDETVLLWIMHLKHKRLKDGEPIVTHGSSHIRFDRKTKKALYHRDYFDMGEFLYENLPLLGRIVRYIRTKAAG